MEVSTAQSTDNRVDIAFSVIHKITAPFESTHDQFMATWNTKVETTTDPESKASKAWDLVGEANITTAPLYINSTREALDQVTKRKLTDTDSITEMTRGLDNAYQIYIGCLGYEITEEVRKALEKAIVICKEVFRECRRLLNRNGGQKSTKPRGGKKHDEWKRANDRLLTKSLKEAGGATTEKETDWYGRRKHPKNRKGRRN